VRHNHISVRLKDSIASHRRPWTIWHEHTAPDRVRSSEARSEVSGYLGSFLAGKHDLRARNGQKDAKASARLVRVVAVVSKPGESSASRLWPKLRTRRTVTNDQLKLGLEGRIGSPHDSQTNKQVNAGR
jgi:hypothetical protein